MLYGERGAGIIMIYVTAFLMILVLICLIKSYTRGYGGLKAFNRDNTLPLRGLLALLIVAHHLGQRTDIFGISYFASSFGYQIVAVFFLLSGYGLCVSYMAKRKEYLHGFLHRRLGKLLPKFIMLTLIMMLAYHIFCGSSIYEQVIKFFSNGVTPLPHSWFICAIIYVYISFYLCAFWGNSPLCVGICFLLSSLLYIFIVNYLLHYWEYWWMTILSVNVGYFIALYERKITMLINNHRFISYSLMIAALFLSFCAICKIFIFASVLLMIFIIVQALSVYVIVRTLGLVRWKWLCAVSVFSLELYLVHGIPLEIGMCFIQNDYCLWLFTYAISIPMAMLLNKYIALIHLKNRSVLCAICNISGVWVLLW